MSIGLDTDLADSINMRRTGIGSFERVVFAVTVLFMGLVASAVLAKSGQQWGPALEWSVTNSTWSGSPFDLVATVTFSHQGSSETRTTEMFYAGGNTWKFRFSGTQVGTWDYSTSSPDSDLDGLTGTATISAAVSTNPQGFVANSGNKWVRGGKAFIPQYVMAVGPQGFHNNSSLIASSIQTFMVEHGFTGFNIPVWCRWFDLNEPKCTEIDQNDPEPDLRTFDALEDVIQAVYNAGGSVHIWAWGDNSRRWNPNYLPGGINGFADQRLQRYIASRLGPLPGWTMGYGFDLDEWVTKSELAAWHDYMHDHLGSFHHLGARPAGPNRGTNHSSYSSWNNPMDYASYEHHKPDYDVYEAALAANSSKPVMSEDRFRIRNEGRGKDYDMTETRRGLWQSAIAGGVANIWGNLLGSGSGANDGLSMSKAYPNPAQIKTYATFFEDRFAEDLSSCNQLTNGYCLANPSQSTILLYRENTSSITIDLSAFSESRSAIAVDTEKAYSEIDLGDLPPESQTIDLPSNSDWAIAIEGSGSPPPPPTDFRLTVGKKGTGSGVVASSPAGIDCGSTCAADFSEDTVVQLTATPDAGSVFTGWSGASDCNDATVTMTKNKTCNANFDVSSGVEYTLTVSKTGSGTGTITSNPSGIDCGSDCQEVYTSGSVIQLVATPDAGSTFAGWSGNADCTDGSVELTKDLACEAEFLPDSGTCAGLVRIESWSTAPQSSYELATAQIGENIYSDRSYKIRDLSGGFITASLVQTANDDKNVSASNHLELTLCRDATVFIAYDRRADAPPDWVLDQGWSETSLIFATSDGGASPMVLYEKKVAAGALVLGGNEGGASGTGAGANYVVVVTEGSPIFVDRFESGDLGGWLN